MSCGLHCPEVSVPSLPSHGRTISPAPTTIPCIDSLSGRPTYECWRGDGNQDRALCAFIPSVCVAAHRDRAPGMPRPHVVLDGPRSSNCDPRRAKNSAVRRNRLSSSTSSARRSGMLSLLGLKHESFMAAPLLAFVTRRIVTVDESDSNGERLAYTLKRESLSPPAQL